MASINPTTAQCPAEWMTVKGAYMKFWITSISDSDAATNKRYISWKVTYQGEAWVKLYGLTATFGGQQIISWLAPQSSWNTGDTLTSGNCTFNNDNNGNLSLSFYMKQLFYYDTWAWDQGYAQEVSTTFTCSQLLRYANFTSHTATSEINKITVTYTADANYKAQQYQINGGSWTDCTAGSYSITGLSPDTEYTIKTKIQRTDSSLWKESDTITIKTKALPDSVAPANIDFNSSGNTITPSLSSMDYIDEWYVIVKDGNTQVRSFSGNVSTTISKDYTLTGSDFTGMLPRHTDIDNWNLTVLYKIKSNGTSYDLTNRTCKCTIPASQYLPSYSSSNISYAVIDSLTLSLNNNNTTKVIKGVSNVRVTSTAASPQGSATMSSYIASSGTKSNSGTTTTAPITIELTQVDGNSVSVQAVDSRGRSTTATKNYTAAIDYFNPVVDSSTIVRVDGIGTNLSVNISGRYCNWSGLATSNTIEQVSIKYRIKGAASWTTKTGVTFTRNVGNGNFNITGNITGNNFIATNEYELLLTFKDKVNNFEILANIPTGESFLWRDLANKRLGINKKPTKTLDVAGEIKASSNITTSGNVNISGNIYFNGTSLDDKLNPLLNAVDNPIGTIIPFAGTTIPSGYMSCDGSAISRTTYAELFAIIGITYGDGDGSTTFNLPNLNNKFVLGSGTKALASTGGDETVQLTANQLPKMNAHWRMHGEEDGTGFYVQYGNMANGTKYTNKYKNNGSSMTGADSYGVSISFGNDEAHNNMPPYMALRYIIKVARGIATVPNSVIVTNADVAQINTNKTDITDIKTDITDIKTNGTGVIENGTGTNCKYTKFADGTLIIYGYCYLSVGTTKTTYFTTVNFPVSFIDTTYAVNITSRNSWSMFTGLYPCCGTRTVNSCQIGGWYDYQTSSGGQLDFMIMGRWK